MADTSDGSKFTWRRCQPTLAITQSLIPVDSMFSENIAVEPIGLFHLPIEWTRRREKSVNGFKRAVPSFGVDCEEDRVRAQHWM